MSGYNKTFKDIYCLKQYKFTFNHKTVVNIYVLHEINLWPCKHSAGFMLGNSSFGAAKLTKTLISTKPLLIRSHKFNGFIKIYGRSRYLILFVLEKYDATYNRVRHFINKK